MAPIIKNSTDIDPITTKAVFSATSSVVSVTGLTGILTAFGSILIGAAKSAAGELYIIWLPQSTNNKVDNRDRAEDDAQTDGCLKNSVFGSCQLRRVTLTLQIFYATPDNKASRHISPPLNDILKDIQHNNPRIA